MKGTDGRCQTAFLSVTGKGRGSFPLSRLCVTAMGSEKRTGSEKRRTLFTHSRLGNIADVSEAARGVRTAAQAQRCCRFASHQ